MARYAPNACLWPDDMLAAVRGAAVPDDFFPSHCKRLKFALRERILRGKLV
jgi:hypothetical protein